MADYFSRIMRCVQYVQAKVQGGDGTAQIQLNRRQCEYLADELLKVSQFLQDREVHHLGLEEGIRRTALLHLHATVKRAQLMVEGCCCVRSSWLATGITMGDTKEEFIAILLDLHQWKFVLGIAMSASAGDTERAQLQQVWETGEEGYQSLSKKNSKMQNEFGDAARQDREELLEKIENLTTEDQRGDDYLRGVYLKAWLNPAEGDLQNVEELKAHSIGGDINNVLGRGGSGSVLKGKWLGQEVALKRLENIDPTEATVLGKLQHPNIIRLFHYWEYTADCPCSCIVMELMPRDLQKHIVRAMGQRSKLPSTARAGVAGVMPFLLPVAIDTMLQVAQAMRELHEKGLMHRDLKTSNILVKPVHENYLELHSEGYLEVKLADFGSAKTYANTSQTADLTRNQGTPAYGAPEIFEKEKMVRERNFPPKADVWSFGMTCSEILTGAIPFAGEARPSLHARIKKDGLRPNLPDDCPWYLQFCIRSCWELRPQNRPSFSDLCKMLRHAKLMSLGLMDVVDVKCLFWYQTSAGVLKSGVQLMHTQEEVKKSRSILGSIWFNLRGAGGSSKSQSQKPPASGADGSAQSQSQKPPASGADGSVKSRNFSETVKKLMEDGTATRGSRYTLAEVMTATNGNAKFLGEGRYGAVFYGRLASGQEVAVKVAAKPSLPGSMEYIKEIESLTRVHHKNLVSLVGYCDEGDNLILLYEYMSKGSVQEYLYGEGDRKRDLFLDWKTRLQVALDAAQGLEYLHVGCDPVTLHREVKSANIFLNHKQVVKVADFGLSKSVESIWEGTFGYLDPEFYTSIALTDKSDVYGFGIFLLELICARPPFIQLVEDRSRIDEWVRSHLMNGAIEEIVDPAIRGQYNLEALWTVVDLAIYSVEPRSMLRPNMSTVVQGLRTAVAIENNESSSSFIGPPAAAAPGHDHAPFRFEDENDLFDLMVMEAIWLSMQDMNPEEAHDEEPTTGENNTAPSTSQDPSETSSSSATGPEQSKQLGSQSAEMDSIFASEISSGSDDEKVVYLTTLKSR